MPTPEQVLSGLGEVANTWEWLAVAWHVYLAVLVLGLVLGVRPSRRASGILVTLPLLSVSALAWRSGNPFNGSVFALVAVLLLAVSVRLGNTRAAVAPPWASVPGAVMVAFGWIYPHFLEAGSLAPYLYSAPTGLIPCPTLSAAVGFGLLLGGLGSRRWTWVVGVTGLFYGIFGAARLRVSLDWVLTAGALWLIVVSFTLRRGVQAAGPGPKRGRADEQTDLAGHKIHRVLVGRTCYGIQHHVRPGSDR